MTIKNQRNQILESLETLDHVQAEKVINYIEGLRGSNKDANYQRVKREAMIQIRHALGKVPSLTPGF
jgi:hypothetical protein